MYSQRNYSAPAYKINQLKRDLEDLAATGNSGELGHQQISNELAPYVRKALDKGCTVSAIMRLIQSYGVSIDLRSIGINQYF